MIFKILLSLGFLFISSIIISINSVLDGLQLILSLYISLSNIVCSVEYSLQISKLILCVFDFLLHFLIQLNSSSLIEYLILLFESVEVFLCSDHGNVFLIRNALSIHNSLDLVSNQFLI